MIGDDALDEHLRKIAELEDVIASLEELELLHKIAELEDVVASSMEQLELLHRAMATEPFVRNLPLDSVTVAMMYLVRALAARRIEALGCYGNEACAEATGASARNVRLAIDAEKKDIDWLVMKQRTENPLN